MENAKVAPELPTDEELPDPTKEERVAMALAQTRRESRKLSPRVKGAVKNNDLSFSPPHKDDLGWSEHLRDSFGTKSSDFVSTQLGLLINALTLKGNLEQPEINSALALITSVEAQNEVEAAMAVQIAAAHVLAMRMTGRAGRAEYDGQRDSLINGATKLQRTMTAQIEALASIRRGGKQQVVVKHVHVYQGANGQAVIGDVHHTADSRGLLENGSQVHGTGDIGTLALAHGEEMRSQEEERQPLPVARGTR